MNRTKEIVLAGLFIAFGLIVPSIFHSFNLPGNVFLPMHIPVFLAGMVFSPMIALLVGVLTPLASNLITGMPPLFPMLPIMIVELGAYGLIASLVRRKFATNYLVSYLIAMLAGRILSAIMVAILASSFGVDMHPITYFTGGFVKGLPGIIIQLFLIPILGKFLNRWIGNLIN